MVFRPRIGALGLEEGQSDAPRPQAIHDRKRSDAIPIRSSRFGDWVLWLMATLACFVAMAPASASPASAAEGWIILVSPAAGYREQLAAHEMRRYLYLRCGELFPIQAAEAIERLSTHCIVMVQKERGLAGGQMADPKLKSDLASLGGQEYWIVSLPEGGSRMLILAGGDSLGVLYAAYRFAELLGVRFYLHGDVVPDEHVPFQMPDLNERARPLFSLRGILPFHAYPEGPDWWDRDDYLAILTQLSKLRMNFIGLHTYAESDVNAEPTTWIGLVRDVGSKSAVQFGYSSSYHNTQRNAWGYEPKNTGAFAGGSSQLFDRDAYGAEVMRDSCPRPIDPAGAQRVFNRTGLLLAEVFRQAHLLGIKTCVGTEMPLAIPEQLRVRLRALNWDPTSPTTTEQLYQGIFRRLMMAYQPDFYWLWTSEHWTWQGSTPDEVKAVAQDLKSALAAAKQAGVPFQLATCGWVLEPPGHNGLFEQLLPRTWPMGCLNRRMGNGPVNPALARLANRPRWALPWLEDDAALTIPQLWAGRMRADAFDARAYGCEGLIGVHWHTRGIAPSTLALARAAWNQDALSPADAETSGWADGLTAAFPAIAVQGTSLAPLYQTLRFNMSLCRLAVSNGTYRVILKFCEPQYREAGRRVFAVRIQGQTVLDRFDIFARAGRHRALDCSFANIQVTDGRLDIEFDRQVDWPCIAAMEIQGDGYSHKINCGGLAFTDYSPDLPDMIRALPALDLYQDWAAHEFGLPAGNLAGQLLAKLDGRLPRPTAYDQGPGGVKADPRPWAAIASEYAFVNEWEGLRPQISGPGNCERFDYWLNTFRYLRAVARVGSLWAEYNRVTDQVKAESEPGRKKNLAKTVVLPARRQLVEGLGAVYQGLLATISNPGELGTIANWEQHILPRMIDRPGAELEQLLGEPLPATALLSTNYIGPTRIIVPTCRTSISGTQDLTLKVLILAARPPREAALLWRPMGQGEFHRLSLVHVSRGVYTVSMALPLSQESDFEYYIDVTSRDTERVFFPTTAPSLNQTVVVLPWPKGGTRLTED